MNMGIGKLGSGNLIYKRQYAYTFSVINLCSGNGTTKIGESFVKMASRPSWDTEETQIDFLNAKTFIPGKTTLDTLTVTYYDVASVDQRPLWSWLASVYNFNDPVRMPIASKASDYSGTGIIVMYDTVGTPLEQWVLLNCWPKSVKFGELANDSNDIATIELTLRYTGLQYKSLCPEYTPYGCYSYCGDTSSSGTGGGLATGIAGNNFGA